MKFLFKRWCSMKILSIWKKKSSKLYKWFYIVAIVIFTAYFLPKGISVKRDYSSGRYIQENVNIHRFEMISCDIVDDLTFNSTDENCRLIYNGDIDTLYMDCLYTYGLREFIAYYNTTGDYTFNEENILRPINIGKYLIYDFPEDTKQVKMPFPNSRMYFNEIILNCRDHTNDYNFTMSDLFSLAILPTFIFLFVDIILSFINSIFNKQKNTSKK